MLLVIWKVWLLRHLLNTCSQRQVPKTRRLFGIALCATSANQRFSPFAAMSGTSSLVVFGKIYWQLGTRNIGILQYLDPQRVHEARQAPEQYIREMTADVIMTYGITTATSWGITGGQVAMHHGGGASAKAGPPDPGHGDWADTFEVGNSARSLSCGLGIPSSIRMGIYSDSTLIMYLGKSRSTGIFSFHNAHPHYHIHSNGISGGATLKGILNLCLPSPKKSRPRT